MKRLDLPLLSDTVFSFFGGWLFFLCLFRFYRLGILPAVLLSMPLGALCGTGIFLILYARKRKKLLTQKDLEEKKKLSLHLALSPANEVEALLAPWNKGGDVYLFRMQPLSADDIAKELARSGGAPFTLYCNRLSDEARELADDFCLDIVDGDEVYKRLSNAGRLPTSYRYKAPKKRTYKEKFRLVFSRRNAANFTVSGFFLLAMSLFTFFPVYYIVAGSLLLFASLCIRLFGAT